LKKIIRRVRWISFVPARALVKKKGDDELKESEALVEKGLVNESREFKLAGLREGRER